MNSDFKWICFVSRRINRVNADGRTAAAAHLAALGISLGVMALIVVMSVMNGFQMRSIDSIMEISSYHVQVTDVEKTSFEQWSRENKDVICAVPFYEAQGLMVGNSKSQCAAVVRAVPENIMELDPGFRRTLKIVVGDFDLSSENSIIIGSTLANSLRAGLGSVVNIAALSGSSDVEMLSSSRQFVVTGIFYCGYAEINSSFAFIGFDAGKKILGNSSAEKYGVKLASSSKDVSFVRKCRAAFSNAKIVSWREYNRSFFGVLRMEKNTLFVIVLLIFLVVAINIFNSMKKLVLERKNEIAVLSALGGSAKNVQAVFITQGAITGFAGAVTGLILGIFITLNMKTVFALLSKIQFGIEYIAAMIFNPEYKNFVTENPLFAIYARISPRIFLHEVFLIFFFGLISSVAAALISSRSILKMTVSEVLRDE
ncbi:ABC transporter permease [Treponema sp.]|uniref:ABC transporter permease n=1 Tax=Treponema sp. TaxID=166 RepID=UPI003F03834C